MKVRELIEKLAQMPQEMEVKYLDVETQDEWADVEQVDITEDWYKERNPNPFVEIS